MKASVPKLFGCPGAASFTPDYGALGGASPRGDLQNLQHQRLAPPTSQARLSTGASRHPESLRHPAFGRIGALPGGNFHNLHHRLHTCPHRCRRPCPHPPPPAGTPTDGASQPWATQPPSPHQDSPRYARTTTPPSTPLLHSHCPPSTTPPLPQPPYRHTPCLLSPPAYTVQSLLGAGGGRQGASQSLVDVCAQGRSRYLHTQAGDRRLGASTIHGHSSVPAAPLGKLWKTGRCSWDHLATTAFSAAIRAGQQGFPESPQLLPLSQ